MGYTFLEFIKRTGIFLICAESILHFMPGSSYQKYVKVLIGIMVLAQFLIPLKAFFTGTEKAEIEQQIVEFQQMIESQGAEMQSAELWSVTDSEITIEQETKKEIKSRLNNIATENGYQIEDIIIDKIIYVIIRERKWKSINIQKIELEQKQGGEPQMSEELLSLKALFSKELGIEAEYLEVVTDD